MTVQDFIEWYRDAPRFSSHHLAANYLVGLGFVLDPETDSYFDHPDGRQARIGAWDPHDRDCAVFIDMP